MELLNWSEHLNKEHERKLYALIDKYRKIIKKARAQGMPEQEIQKLVRELHEKYDKVWLEYAKQEGYEVRK